MVVIDGVEKRFSPEARPALNGITGTVERGRITGLVGPDGAGKTTLLRLMTGLMTPDRGALIVDGVDSREDSAAIQEIIGYMPQRFGLYEDLTVIENLSLYADLRAVVGAAREETFAELLAFTALGPFTDRLAGALSGGMKQKLGLACTLLSKPRLLLLDEPSVGVDPISRRELWRMVDALIDDGITVVWSSAYLDEAEQCDDVLLLNEGELLFFGPPEDLTHRVAGRTYHIRGVDDDRRMVLSRALNQDGVVDGVLQGQNIRLVLQEGRQVPDAAALGVAGSLRAVEVAPRFEDAFVDILGGGPGGTSVLADRIKALRGDGGPVIEAEGLTKRFGSFTAVSDVSFSIRMGEVFGLLGPNGAGKSTTFKMLCGLMQPTLGGARVVGLDLKTAPGRARAHIGYMAQKFSLYGNLSVLQNLRFFAGVYGLTGRARRVQVERMIETFALKSHLSVSADDLPLGFKQRLALSCALMHEPEVLFLDEPTSGVDPITRREFWAHINALVEKGVTIMVTTHFMDEAEYCDRLALIYRGREIATGAPQDLKARVRTETRPDPTLEDAFIALIEDFDARQKVPA
ncbi:ATP-binding cassette domain-containing protein [Varunaivibrio sulfuroxidans]|nr:ATP-binding cassette domain-containing protein [Varunaivibrio sulfuroxidans]WES30163.1 ATP-binding cassette domain-containing protein [Varunaivibrio sulfuroxidans]